MEHADIVKAIMSLRPGALFSVVDTTDTESGAVTSVVVWDDANTAQQPSDDAIGAEIARLSSAEYILEQTKLAAIDEVRKERAPILTALAGIGFDAREAGDEETATAVALARAALKEITVLPAFLAATTYDAMKAAIMARYREIADGAPANVQTAFREVFAS
jgi:hypothetical protein